LHDLFVDRLDRHRTILFKIANVYCKNAADREDLIAEMSAQLWRSYARFDERSKFSTWMYRVAMNVAISFYRGESRKRANLVPLDPAIETPVAQESAGNDQLDVLHELIDRLDPLDRALMLLYLDDYPQAEIAAILGISQTNAATKIGRIKERFRRAVAQQTQI
jgi:RNA polymerase sigma factor (sigma-70 family)